MLKKISRFTVKHGICLLQTYPVLYRPLRGSLRFLFPKLYSKLLIFLAGARNIRSKVPSLGERGRRIHIVLRQVLMVSKKKQ